MTYSTLLQILMEAECRAANHEDEAVRKRSQETVNLCNARLALEGVTRAELERLAKEESRK